MPKHKVMIMILSQYRTEHIDEVYDMLDEDQREIIQHYMNDGNLSNTIIVISGHRIIDGNHRALAAAIKGVSINYVDLSELDNAEVDEDISRRGFLGGLAGAAALGATGAQAKIHPTATPPLKAQPVANNPKVDLLMKWAKQFIKDPAELAAFMAQCAHESDNFKTMNEYGTPERFAHKYDIQFNPKKAKELGNNKPGDGIKYRGRGYIQLTGKYNYEKAGEWISKFLNHPVDFVSNPNMVATPTAAALSSIWYWINFVRPRIKSFNNTKQVTKHINTGLKGQANREQKAKDWQTALNVKPTKPVQGIKVTSK
jgi:putative chitinase